MAVQAQYPSNVLLLNRNIQEGKVQPGRGGGDSGGGGGGGGGGVALFDQPHMLYNSGVTANNSRKRGREMISTTTMNGSSSNPLMSITLQQQQQQQQQQHHHQSSQMSMIDLTQLHNNVAVSTGLGLAFGDQQHQNHHHHHHHHLHQQHYSHSQQQQQNSLSPQSSVSFSLFSDDFASQIKHQCDEIHRFVQIQGEQMRRELAEKRQRQYRELLVVAEEAVVRRLREKEVEVEKAVRRNAELEARAAQLSAEAQAWQARARAQEATAATLQAQLQQAMMGGAGAGGCSAADRDEWGNNGVDGGAVAEDAESAYVDPDRVAVLTGPSCKTCRKRVASAVLLPCRHLCLCTECDAVAQACPLCFTFRSSSVEVNLC